MAGFDHIIGHSDVVEHLKNAMKMDKVSHAYIFNGEKGCGKKTLAREFAKALQCQGGRPNDLARSVPVLQTGGRTQPAGYH